MLFTDCLLHALEDTARLLPFLFLTYLVMEYLEQRAGERSAQAVRRTGRLGPLAGAALGAVPQCGVPAAASSLSFSSSHMAASVSDLSTMSSSRALDFIPCVRGP